MGFVPLVFPPPPFFRNLFFQICGSGAIRLKKCTYITKIFTFCSFFATSMKRFAQKSKQSCNCQRENTESGDLRSGFKVVNRSCVICTEVYTPKKCFQWYRFGSTFKSVSHLYSWTALLYKKMPHQTMTSVAAPSIRAKKYALWRTISKNVL